MMSLTVFVSSTLEDLNGHRQSVNTALRGMGVNTVDVFMERTHQADLLQTSLMALQGADLFLGIYASRYGELLDGQDISLIERLYEESGNVGLPRFIYLVDPREDWAVSYMHTDFYGAKMRIFLDRINQENPNLRHFTSPGDLVEKLTFDLARFRTQQPEPTRRSQRHLAIGLLIVSSIILIAALRVGAIL
jgi:hypothetical protein